MKHPIPVLALSLLALSLTTAAHAHSDRPWRERREAHDSERLHHPHRLERVFHRAARGGKSAGHAVRDFLSMAAEGASDAAHRTADAGRGIGYRLRSFASAARAGARSGIHRRPELLGSHLVALRKGNEVVMAYCQPRLRHFLRSRAVDTSVREGRCEQVMHQGAFDIGELRSCSARYAGESRAAFHLQRQLSRVIRRDEGYDFNYLSLHDDPEAYLDLFQQCGGEIGRAKRGAVARTPRPAPVAPPLASVEPQPAENLAPDTGVSTLPPISAQDFAAPLMESLSRKPAAPAALELNGTLGEEALGN